MQKLPEVLNRKMRWRMRKRKKSFLLTKGTILSFFQAVTSGLITSLLSCLDTTPTSFDVVMVSPFIQVATLSRSTWCWDIRNPQLNYKLIPYRTLINFQKETNPQTPDIFTKRKMYIYSDTHKYWIQIIFCYNSSLCSPFCLIFSK